MSNLELNKGDNFIFGIDVSGSMGTSDCPGGLSRIQYLKENVKTFINEAAKYDDDGIDVITFGHSIKHTPGVSPANVASIIDPLTASESMTKTADLIQKAYDLHVAGKYQQTVLFVATDGEPADRNAVKEVIRGIASKLANEHEFAISILTVGVPDAGLSAFLTELDDDLKAQHDIVDVKALDQVDFMTAFVGALHD